MRSTLTIATVLLAAACTTNPQQNAGGGTGGKSSTGGVSSTGAVTGTGGTTAKGGTTSSGGTIGNGGTTGNGGSIGNGGSSGSGGTTGSGGMTSNGGTTGAGGTFGGGGTAGGGGTSGGASGTGGKVNTGGGTSSGGTSNAGGTSNSGGAGGSGGTSNTGGTSSTGGTSGAGGTSGNGGGTGTGGANGGSTGATCASVPISASAAAVNAAEYDAWKTCWVKAGSGDPGTFVVINAGSCGQGDWVVSEGIGYGMLLAVANNDRTTFDGLWKFYKDHENENGVMNWSCQRGDAPGNNKSNGATDGDVDVAMGLVQADTKWGGYKTDALTLIHTILKWEVDTDCGGLSVERPGDMFGGCRDQYNPGKVNPSYFAPGYFRAWAKYDTANATAWTKLADDSYTLLFKIEQTMGQPGLVPEWGYTDGRAEGGYAYNACRTPWRIAVDYAWFCNANALAFLKRVSTYVDGHGGIKGVPYDKNSAFLGAFALSGIAVGQTKLDSYVTDWLTTSKPLDAAYFQGSLRLVYALLAGGQFGSGVP